jgi:hypothetical protein
LQIGFRHQRGDGDGVLIRQAQFGQRFSNERFQAIEGDGQFRLQDRYSSSQGAGD